MGRASRPLQEPSLIWNPQWINVNSDYLLCYAQKEVYIGRAEQERIEILELYASCRFLQREWIVKLGGFNEIKRFEYLEDAQAWVNEQLILDKNPLQEKVS